MSSISALSSNIAHPGLTSTQKKPLGAFEVNAKQYGPVVATAMGVAQATGEAAHAGVSFSNEALKRLHDAGDALADAASAAWDGTVAGVHDLAKDIEQGLSDGYHGMVDEASELGGDLKDAVQQAYAWGQSVEHSVADAASSVANSVEDAASAVTDTLGDMVDGAASYVAIGLSVLKD